MNGDVASPARWNEFVSRLLGNIVSRAFRLFPRRPAPCPPRPSRPRGTGGRSIESITRVPPEDQRRVLPRRRNGDSEATGRGGGARKNRAGRGAPRVARCFFNSLLLECGARRRGDPMYDVALREPATLFLCNSETRRSVLAESILMADSVVCMV